MLPWCREGRKAGKTGAKILVQSVRHGKTKVPKEARDLQIWCEKVQFLCQTQLGLGRMCPRARRPQVVLQIRCLRKGFGTKTSMRDNQK